MRTRGESFEPIDASGELVDGRKFSGIEELKGVLLSRKEDFTRAFVQHMLAGYSGTH